ncbi:antibiotic biosynthesis monooxygenase [Dyadobacter sp. 676]|uniref:Antibiotic biosynthesis monooxygenase n=1 Tax=Dyadobacter sp. 676 TaxID=3088362 RepID=A0AAU8FK32_9BACT
MKIFLISLLLVAGAAMPPAFGQQKEWMVRVAKIEIDSAYLEPYKAAIREHTRAAIASEPGVLTLYAMYDKDHPTRVTVLEIYASKEAYQAHLKTPHFQKYKTGTLKMVKSLQLIDVDPIAFGAKPDIFEKK